jgi:hypothetical protein
MKYTIDLTDTAMKDISFFDPVVDFGCKPHWPTEVGLQM